MLISLYSNLKCIYVFPVSDKSQLKDMKFIVKEGVKYKIMITFNVQREIVAGLRLSNKVSRGPISSKYSLYM